ncbi:hypothetical protein B0H14DRAFT_2638113 [Mycena olivaceomarginata]|nr:hypothetical protein B0H14DRAFT_2638113 [Mycena olivaceomarginata]
MTTFEDILPTSHQDQVLNVMVDNQNDTIPTEQSTDGINHSTDNMSAHSIDSDANQENLGQTIESLDDSQSRTSDLDSTMPPEASTADENSDFSEKKDTVSDITGYEEQFDVALGHDLDLLGDLVVFCTARPEALKSAKLGPAGPS